MSWVRRRWFACPRPLRGHKRLVCLSTAVAWAQEAPPEKPAARSPGKVRFDPASIVTVSGTVLAEFRVDRGKPQKGVHIALKTTEGQISVHLGPDSWIDKQPLKLEKGDEVTVKGSKVVYDGKPFLIAQSVSRRGETMVLRDAAGKPAWGPPPKR
jgi:hypothetical protein